MEKEPEYKNKKKFLDLNLFGLKLRPWMAIIFGLVLMFGIGGMIGLLGEMIFFAGIVKAIVDFISKRGKKGEPKESYKRLGDNQTDNIIQQTAKTKKGILNNKTLLLILAVVVIILWVFIPIASSLSNNK